MYLEIACRVNPLIQNDGKIIKQDTASTLNIGVSSADGCIINLIISKYTNVGFQNANWWTLIHAKKLLRMLRRWLIHFLHNMKKRAFFYSLLLLLMKYWYTILPPESKKASIQHKHPSSAKPTTGKTHFFCWINNCSIRLRCMRQYAHWFRNRTAYYKCRVLLQFTEWSSRKNHMIQIYKMSAFRLFLTG